jgi:hypothetical protein
MDCGMDVCFGLHERVNMAPTCGNKRGLNSGLGGPQVFRWPVRRRAAAWVGRDGGRQRGHGPFDRGIPY